MISLIKLIFEALVQWKGLSVVRKYTLHSV